jgi:hypothetical protein
MGLPSESNLLRPTRRHRQVAVGQLSLGAAQIPKSGAVVVVTSGGQLTRSCGGQMTAARHLPELCHSRSISG